MSADTVEVAVFEKTSPKVRKVGMDRPWAWLSAGWRDIRRSPGVSLGYGLLFTVAGIVIVGVALWLGLFSLVLPAATGFMLVAPVLVVGLYYVSRCHERGEKVTNRTPLEAWTRNGGQIAFMGFVLGFLFLVWMRIATLLFALFFSRTPPDISNFINDIVFSTANIPFLAIGTAIGAVLSILVFAISVISVPMLLDREDSNVFTAIATSFVAVRENKATMLAWAVLIALFTIAGIATAFVGLAITMPLIAHATYHAYKDVVVPESESAAKASAQGGGKNKKTGS